MIRGARVADRDRAGRARPASAPPARTTRPATPRPAGRRRRAAGPGRRRRGSRTAVRHRTDPAVRWRGPAAAASGSTSACRPTRRSVSVRRCGCSRARSRAARGRAYPRPADRAGSESTRHRRRRTTRVAVATGWWSGGTGKTPAAHRRRPLRAATRPAGCCRFAARPAPGMPTGDLSPAKLS